MTRLQRIKLLLEKINEVDDIPEPNKKFVQFILADDNLILGWMAINSVIFALDPQLIDIMVSVSEYSLTATLRDMVQDSINQSKMN